MVLHHLNHSLRVNFALNPFLTDDEGGREPVVTFAFLLESFRFFSFSLEFLPYEPD